MILFGVPLLLGLIWNKWAGGAAGFIMGTLYYLGMAGYSTVTYLQYGMTVNFYADASLIVYIVTGILMGYVGGALNNKSTKLKRMLGAGLTASIATGLIMFMVNIALAIEVSRNMAAADPAYSFFLTMLPQVILGILIPVIAKVFTWYGLGGGHS
jgi:LytS/YehU family sensor histidine kinase